MSGFKWVKPVKYDDERTVRALLEPAFKLTDTVRAALV